MSRFRLTGMDDDDGEAPLVRDRQERGMSPWDHLCASRYGLTEAQWLARREASRAWWARFTREVAGARPVH